MGIKRKHKLFEVEIKSMSLINEGKKGLICYFRGGSNEQIISNLKKMYPQYLKVEDKPIVNITEISEEEYKKREQGIIVQHQMNVDGKFRGEPNGTVEN